MADLLHVYRYGPDRHRAQTPILAIHGLTGHGRRWETLATQHLAEHPVAAPDLLGHGRSSWDPPWTLEANTAALARLLESDGPALVVGHSFGGAVAMNLAAARPDLVTALVLLDPAVGLAGAWMRQIAEQMYADPDYTDREEARDEKFTGSWADVPVEDLEAELDEHLINLPNGRCGWRVSVPAMMSYWSELARDIVLPPKGTPTTVVRASWTAPPYVGEELVAGLSQQLGTDFTMVDFPCQHMVAQAKPAEVAEVIRARLGHA